MNILPKKRLFWGNFDNFGPIRGFLRGIEKGNDYFWGRALNFLIAPRDSIEN
jgi:hypothetical protein